VVTYGRATAAKPDDDQVRTRLYFALLEQGRQALADGRFDGARASFDPPVIWMPQSFDSSSGGQLWVESELGKGSTFGLVLPIDAKAAQENGRRLEAEEASRPRRPVPWQLSHPGGACISVLGAEHG